MKIAINALVLKSAGNITYFSNILPEIEKQDIKNEYFVFSPPNWREKLNVRPERLKFIEVNFFTKNLILREFYEQIILPFKLKFLKIDLLYCPSDIACLFAPCKIILAIRNPNPYFKFGKQSFFLKFRFKIQKIVTKFSVLKAKKIIFVSNFSKEKISEQLKIKKEKVVTIYHGFSEDFFKEINEKEINKELRETIDNLSPCILSISNLYPHKNFEVLILAYNNLGKELKDKYKLLIAGDFTFPNYFLNLKKIVDQCFLDKNVIFLGPIPYRITHYLYKKAILFVLPSCLETFGHTLVEAMASGVPLIASNSTAIPEIMADGGLLFDYSNANELTEKMTLCLKNDEIRQELIMKGFERRKDFSWQKNVSQLLNVFCQDTK